MIKVQNLSKSYENGVLALDNISFLINKGDICGYVGANGAGKSTTIKILTGTLDFAEGSVNIFDFKLPENNLDVKKIIGYVPESADLFNSLKVSEFFEFINKIRDIDKNKFNSRVNYFSELFSFNEYLDFSIGNLSKGNKQKVLIVSALLHNPDIIFLDEPLNGLDSSSILVFQDMISKLAKKGKIIFYCSHLLDMLEKISTRIIFIEKGKIVLDKGIEELKKSADYKNLEELFKSEITKDNLKSFEFDEAYS